MIVNINEKTLIDFIEKLRPPVEIRSQLDYAYSMHNNTILLFELRPNWMSPENDEMQQLPFAKIRYYKSQAVWKLYWMRANGNWELYKPFPIETSLDKLLNEVKEDKHACFFG